MNIDRLISKLLVKYPSFGSITANCKYVADDSIKTAATDGEKIYYSPIFMQSLSEEEQLFVLAHEISHIAFNHVYRLEEKDEKTWNIATDAVINISLADDGLPLPKGAVFIEKAADYDAESLYNMLINNKVSDLQNNNNGNSNSNQSNSKDYKYDVGHDTHAMWKKALDKKKNNEGNNIKDKESKNNRTDDDKSNVENDKLNINEKEVFDRNKEIRDKNLEELRKSLVSKSHGYGRTTNSNQRIISDIGVSKPFLDWRRVLVDNINNDVDWSYQNAVIEDGVLTPCLEKMPYSETEIILDTSGSVNDSLLRNFLHECKNILQTSKLKVGCFDTKFYGFTEIRNASDIDNLVLTGGWGTDFNVLVNAFSKRANNKIIFTDGDAPMPSEPLDAIWIVFGDKKINPLSGRVIYIDEEQLKRLNNNSKSM